MEGTVKYLWNNWGIRQEPTGKQMFSETEVGEGHGLCEPQEASPSVTLPSGVLWLTLPHFSPLCPPFLLSFLPSLIFHPDPSFSIYLLPSSLFLLPLPLPPCSSSLQFLPSLFLTPQLSLSSLFIALSLPPCVFPSSSLPFPSFPIHILYFSLQKFIARVCVMPCIAPQGYEEWTRFKYALKATVSPMEGNLALQLASLTLQPDKAYASVFSVPQTRTPHHSASLAWLIWDMEPTIPIIKLIYVRLCQFIYMLRGLAKRQWAWAAVSKSENKSSRSYKLPLQCYHHTSPLVTRSLHSFTSFLFFFFFLLIRTNQSFLKE